MRRENLLRMVVRLIVSPTIIFTVALAIRIVVLAHLLPEMADRGFYHGNEAARIAWAMASGNGFSSPWPHTPIVPTANQPPVYPALLAVIFKVAGAYSYLSLWIAVLLNAIFSSLTAVLIFRLGKQTFGAVVGILAGWTWACWVYEAAVSVRLWESALSGLMLMNGLCLLWYLRDSRRWFGWCLFGILAGGASLLNTSLLPLFFFFLLWLWVDGRKRGLPATQQVLGAAAICLLTLLPWTIRNYEVFHHVIPVRNNFGLELWIGNHQGVTYLYEYTAPFPLRDPTEYNQLGEMRFMEERQRLALEFIRENPAQFLRLCGQRFFNFWTSPYQKTWFTISLASWLGVVLAIRQQKVLAAPFATVLLVFPAIYYVTHTWSTYRHPIEPVIILLATSFAVSGIRYLLQIAGHSPDWLQNRAHASLI